jgi:hypothetical protein
MLRITVVELSRSAVNPSGRRSDNGLCDARTFAEEAELSDLADVSFADTARFVQHVRGFDIPK